MSDENKAEIILAEQQMPADAAAAAAADSSKLPCTFVWSKRPAAPLHAHWDCFSGAAGDMMLAACLDAAADTQAGDDDDDESGSSLLQHVIVSLRKGLPELADEFEIECQRVWRGSGSMAALHVTVHSIYQHAAAPVPVATRSAMTAATRNNNNISASAAATSVGDVASGVGGGSVHLDDHFHELAMRHHHDHHHDHHHHAHISKRHHGRNDETHDQHEQDARTAFTYLAPPSQNDNDVQQDLHSHRHHHDVDRVDPTHSISAATKIEAVVVGWEDLTEAHHSHSHSHYSHTAGGHKKKNPIRDLPQIRQMLLAAPAVQYIPAWVRDRAIAAFTELALAEAAVHGADSVDDVHFHEVGAVDSIVDTVGTLLALYNLGVETDCSCSRWPVGEGTVRTAHGILPVPAPATLRLMLGMPLTPGPSPGTITGELVTPTAAALLRVLTGKSSNSGNNNRDNNCCRPPQFTLRRVGVGAGTKDFEQHPNVLRLLLGDNVLS